MDSDTNFKLYEMNKIKYIIIFLIISINSFSQNCIADFSYTVDTTNNTISFTDLSHTYDSNIVATAWEWSESSNIFSEEQNPITQYDSLPIIICLDVDFDSTCSANFCDTIYPPSQDEYCFANFSYNLDSNTNEYLFTNTSTSTGLICSFYWDFGDGTSSTDENPSHFYNNTDSFNVCLIIESSDDSCNSVSCLDTICKTIFVNNNTIISISGNVYAKTNLLPKGIAVLNKVETSNYTAIKYTEINNGFYEFNNLNEGNYLVYAIPYFDDLENYYPLYYPTYTSDTAHYNNAELIFADSIEIQDINLKYNEDINHGFGNISGKIVYDYGSNFETNIYNQNWFSDLKSDYEGVAQNITVLLYNNTGQVIRYSLTDENGNFEFKNIPYGTNIIYAEKAGKNTQTISCSLNQENDTIKNIIIHIEETEIINVEKLSIINANIYPNPFNNYLNINFSENLKNISILIYDITGKQIIYTNLAEINPKGYKINTNFLQKGSYILVVKSKDTEIFRRKIIK